MNITEIDRNILKIDTPQMIEVDRLMIEEYHIELIQMMENAGRCLAIVSRDVFLDKDPEGKKVCILAGTGGNGGGALVCARRLSNWGANVSVVLTSTDEKMTEVPRHQLGILRRMGVRISNAQLIEGPYDLIVDGIIGYSVKGDPYGIAKAMIEWANTSTTSVLSLDTPSGLDLTTGTIHNPTIEADATLTLAMPKIGLFAEASSQYVGELYLGDISVPPSLYAEKPLRLRAENVFRHSDIVKIN